MRLIFWLLSVPKRRRFGVNRFSTTKAPNRKGHSEIKKGPDGGDSLQDGDKFGMRVVFSFDPEWLWAGRAEAYRLYATDYTTNAL